MDYVCEAQGRADMYGLGIRIASYMQWLAAVVFERIGSESLPEIRLLGLLLSGGVAMATLAQVAKGSGGLDAAGICIVLLLSTGPHMFLVPVYAWRAATCCDAWWNPLAWTREEQVRVLRVLNFALLTAASSLGVWFYTAYLPGLARGCRQYGFFSKASLDDKVPFAAFNAAFYLLVLLVCVVTVVAKVIREDMGEARRRRRRHRRRMGRVLPAWRRCRCSCHGSRERAEMLRAPQTLAGLTVLAVLVAAIELPVRWNKLGEANRLNTSAQLIPLLVSAGIIARVAFLHYVDMDDEAADANGGRAVWYHEHLAAQWEAQGRLPRVYRPVWMWGV